MRATRKGNGSMKVFGIALVRDEADVIRLSVGHQLSLGLDRVLVVDNGSSDGTTLVLERLSRDDDRIRWSSDAGPYHQAEIMTALAREALRQGADWIVPFDADEFWWVAGGNLRAVLAAVTAGALRAPVVNFVQSRDRLEPSEQALLTMTRRVAAPVNPRPDGQNPVNPRIIPYVERAYNPKCVSRPTNTIEIGRGNHRVKGVAGPVVETVDLVCLHAPLRSRAGLERKAAVGERIEQAGWPGGGGHMRRWRRLQEKGALDREWAANSYVGETLDVYGTERPLVVDFTLRDLVAPLL
jgi:hypothetical protein